MIQIVFGDSAKGGLVGALRFGDGPYHGGGISCVWDCRPGGDPPRREKLRAAQQQREQLRRREELRRRAWEAATPIPGSATDVFAFPLSLSVGDVRAEDFWTGRREALARLHGGRDGYPDPQETVDRAVRDLAQVKARAEAGEEIRIWYSDEPDELCGFYWSMHQRSLWKSATGQVYFVKLPEWERTGDGNMVQANNWGEMAPEDWCRNLALQQTSFPVFQTTFCGMLWRRLQEENAPLRIKLNGRLVGADEDVYDRYLLRELAGMDESFLESALILAVMSRYQLGICDGFLALRIDELVRAGTLAVAADGDDRPYSRTLRRGGFVPA